MKKDMSFLCIERIFGLISGCKNLEKKISPLLLLLKHKACFFRILPLFFISTYFISTKLHKSSRELCTLAVDLCTKLLFFFTSVPNNHIFRSQQWNHLLAQGQNQGSTLNNAPKKPRLPTFLETPVK